MGWSAQAMIAPAALISLATTGGWGWLVNSGMFLAAAIVAPRIVAWAARTGRGVSADALTTEDPAARGGETAQAAGKAAS